MLNVCQIGLGLVSSYWLNALTKNPKTKLVAICDVVPPADLTKYGHVLFYSDYEVCCRDPNIDVVVIAVPPNVHQCLDAARQANTQIYLAYHSMFGATYLKAKQIITELIKKGDSLTHVSSNCLENVRAYGNQIWVFDKSMGGGGVLIDSGINALSILLDNTGPVEVKEAHLYFPNKDAMVEDVIEMSFTSQTG